MHASLADLEHLARYIAANVVADTHIHRTTIKPIVHALKVYSIQYTDLWNGVGAWGKVKKLIL